MLMSRKYPLVLGAGRIPSRSKAIMEVLCEQAEAGEHVPSFTPLFQLPCLSGCNTA